MSTIEDQVSLIHRMHRNGVTRPGDQVHPPLELAGASSLEAICAEVSPITGVRVHPTLSRVEHHDLSAYKREFAGLHNRLPTQPLARGPSRRLACGRIVQCADKRIMAHSDCIDKQAGMR